jgi:hypothetical protein
VTHSSAATPTSEGSLFHNLPEGTSGCPACGWSGVPTFIDGKPSDICPACGIDYEAEMAEALAERQRVVAKIGRNDPCWCGSGKKAKKCCGTEVGVVTT